MKKFLPPVLAVIASMFAPQAHAQSRYWDANGTVAGAGVTPNGTWGTDNFWNTDPTGGSGGSFFTALSSSLIGVFSAGTDATGSYAVSINGTQLAQAININYGNSFTLTNGVLALTRTTSSSTTTGAINTGSTMTGTAEIASTIQLDTAAGSGAILNLIAGNGSAATDLLISGAIANNNTANTYQIRLGGAGNGRITSTLNNANATYGGSITANSVAAWTGTWTIAGNQALGSSVAVTLSADNNKLVMGDSTSDVQSWGGATTVSTNSAVLTVKSTATIGAVTLRGGGGTMAVGGSVSGSTLNMGGTGGHGVLQLADGTSGGSATFTDLTISGAGNKIVGAAGGAGTFTFNLAAGTRTFDSNLALGGVAANENNLNLVKSGAGTLVLSAANTFTGTTRLTAGGIVINHQNALQGSTLTLTNAGTLVFSNAAGTAFTVGGLAASAAGTGYDIVLTNSAGTAIALTAGGNNQSTTYAGVLSGGGSLVKSGTGTLTLSGANSYLGGTLVSGGTLAGSTASLQGVITNNGSVAFAQSTNGTFGSVISGSGSVVKTGVGTLTLSVTNSYIGVTDIAQGTLQLNSSGGLAAVSAVQISNGASLLLARGGGFPLVFSNTISGGGSVIKTGTENVTLAGVNSHTGGTILLNANLILATNSALGTGALTIDSTAGTARLNVNGTTNTVTGLGFAGGSAQVIQNEGAGDSAGRLIIDLASDVTASTLSTTFIRDGSAGTLGLTKNGAGTLDLSALNSGSTYSGGLTVNAGTVRYASFQAFGNSTITLAGGSLDFNSSGTTNIARSVVLETATTSTLTNAAGHVTFNGNFAGDGALTKSGAGTTTFSGSNSFTGATIVSGGTLQLASATGGALATTASVSVETGAVLLLGASNQVADDAEVTLSGGTIRRGGDFTEVFGDLNLTAASFLDYGDGAAGTLRFGAYTPVELLTVQNFSIGSKLQFGNTISAGDLSTKFSFSSAYTTGTEGGFFTITAIPEPSTVVSALGLAGLLTVGAYRSRRRRKSPPAAI